MSVSWVTHPPESESEAGRHLKSISVLNGVERGHGGGQVEAEHWS